MKVCARPQEGEGSALLLLAMLDKGQGILMVAHRESDFALRVHNGVVHAHKLGEDVKQVLDDFTLFLIGLARGTLLLGLVLIPVLFYTYNGVVGKSPDWLHIASFFLSAAMAYFYEARLLHTEGLRCRFPKLAITALLVIALLFVIFTFATPKIGIFKDPLTGAYGI